MIPVIFVVILILVVRYLIELQAVTTSQRAEIQALKEKLKASESDNEQLRGQAQHDFSVIETGRNKFENLTRMLMGVMLLLGRSDDNLNRLEERRSTEASNADAATAELRKANADLRAEVGTLTKDNKALVDRVAEVEKSSDLKTERLLTLAKEVREKEDKIKGFADTSSPSPIPIPMPSLKPSPVPSQKPSPVPSSKPSPIPVPKPSLVPPPAKPQVPSSGKPQVPSSGKSPVPSSGKSQITPPSGRGIAAWNSFQVDDGEYRAKLRREAARQEAEDAKNGIKHDPVEPTFATTHKEVFLGPNGERKLRNVVKEGGNTTGTADSGADAELPKSAPASGPAPATPSTSSATPPATGRPNASIPRGQPDAPKTPASTSAKEKEICLDFQTRGYCRYGNNCKYAHVTGLVAGPAKTPTTPASRPLKVKDKDILCPYFQKGVCKYGEKCRNSHVVTDKTIYNGGLHSKGNNPKLDKAKK